MKLTNAGGRRHKVWIYDECRRLIFWDDGDSDDNNPPDHPPDDPQPDPPPKRPSAARSIRVADTKILKTSTQVTYLNEDKEPERKLAAHRRLHLREVELNLICNIVKSCEYS